MILIENLTPYADIVFGNIDRTDRSFETVVARGVFAIRPQADASGGMTHTLVELDQQDPVLVVDTYFGAIAESEVRSESDLSPYKPRCDVIVHATAHSPTGRPVPAVEVGVTIERAVGRFPSVVPVAEGLLLDRRLVVWGDRDFVRLGAVDRTAASVVRRMTLGALKPSEWQLTDPVPFTAFPIRYDHAFGGSVTVRASEHEVVSRLPEDRRAEPQIGEDAGDRDPAITQEAFAANPLGRGFITPWYAHAAKATRWSAPRIEAPRSPITVDAFERLLEGACPAEPALMPHGLGIVAKHWAPRLRLAGTCDERWQAERCPRLPEDFDEAFWNGSPPDMQCDFLFGEETVSLTNMLPRAEASRSRGDAVVARFSLPRVGLVLRLERPEGGVFYDALRIDTLHIDLDAMRVALTWRLRLPDTGSASVRGTLMALAPILDEQPDLMPGVIASAAYHQALSDREKE
ncbi:DUF2169 family type VI secretion system accessory protein [Methylobacterium indicum]|uniref:DUF2169 domain-containing protein n=1 Tax=Methylobacterium indicum TaxID=1775910 RepID=A0ABR5HCU3_9HYPH|nr:DUF2169 domain-containing protein [Methylobacterium indicum]KMO12275.1 hypothetical protein QR78_27445 [Methylobacterium indicum]KMO23474.1 hypothetical protein QR79_13285 [Methylobacterium indicum]